MAADDWSPLTEDVHAYYVDLLRIDPQGPLANAADVYRQIRREHEGVTLADILRSLADLLDAGLIKPMPGGDFRSTNNPKER